MSESINIFFRIVNSTYAVSLASEPGKIDGVYII